jgi:hypothetical protein
MPVEDFASVVQGMQDRALSTPVGTEKQRDRSKVELHAVANAFEVFDSEAGDHIIISYPLFVQIAFGVALRER